MAVSRMIMSMVVMVLMFVLVSAQFKIEAARHDEDTPFQAHDLNLGAV